MTIADLEAMADKLKEAKREITGQLRSVDAQLCDVLIALAAARNAPTTRTQ